MAAESQCLDQERTFARDELFFSTTDRKGFIQASNDVFVRISGYAAEELSGRAHNIIRHPDMPRVVFKLLWDHLAAGKGIAAYVKNRAKDGSFYWVLAAVRPIPGGHLSVRLKPATPWFALIPGVYAELREVEERVEREGGSRSDAMEASAARLDEVLAANGIDGYDAFMGQAFVDEVMARRAHVASGGSIASRHRLGGTGESLERLARVFDEELARVHRYVALNDDLASSCTKLVSLAGQCSVLAFNAELAGGRLGRDGQALKAVADLLQEVCPRIVDEAVELRDRIEEARTQLRAVGFSVSLASLQNDMVRSFLVEAVRTDAPDVGDHAELLFRGLRGDAESVESTLDVLARRLGSVEQFAALLMDRLDLLSAIERNGRIEAVRTSGAEAFTTLLSEVRTQVAAAVSEGDEIMRLLSSCQLRERRQQRSAVLDALALIDAATLAHREPVAGRS